LFQNDIGVLAGWAHYLAFDLFIGAWMTSNAQRLGLTHWKIIPCLFLTFMFGPVGLLTYFIVRAAMTKKVFHEHF
jgi:phage shock protein PspC (stress-responsive transcriptional regulator)